MAVIRSLLIRNWAEEGIFWAGESTPHKKSFNNCLLSICPLSFSAFFQSAICSTDCWPCANSGAHMRAHFEADATPTPLPSQCGRHPRMRPPIWIRFGNRSPLFHLIKPDAISAGLPDLGRIAGQNRYLWQTAGRSTTPNDCDRTKGSCLRRS